jgi:AAA domain-containing protein
MIGRPINSIDILKFIDGEYRTAARDTLDLHSLEISERAAKFRCIPELTHTGDYIFSYKQNPSKFRKGDYVLLNPFRPDLAGDIIREGGKYIISMVEEQNRLIHLEEPAFTWSNQFTPGPDQKCTVDIRLVNRFPLYTYPAWASGYLSTKKDPGPLIQQILAGKYRDRTLKGPFPDPPAYLLKGQKKAFNHALRHQLSLVQGPPGTGKTFLIAQITEALVNLGLKVFICSFSHRAINNALNACVRETSLAQVKKIGGEYANDDLDEQA